ncbi:MAG: ATP-binding cassette domain-containing protein [Peptococcaceae bacterium]|nr:ATP-binding cassette domain-containing protein [Peptococcaceae bacterium]
MSEQAAARPADAPLVQAEDVKTYFTVKNEAGGKARVRAVDGVTFSIRSGETFGLVGESGCGKSTLGRGILALRPLSGGRIFFDGADVFALKGEARKQFRRSAQLIFQDPSGCLNPRQTVGGALLDPLIIHKIGDKVSRRLQALEMMDTVGLSAHYFDRYPHELSGGQKQRVGIARALLLNPKLVVCDEPVSALDVSIQAQVLNLLTELQRKYRLTYLFISHNLGVVHYVSDRVGVMYCGKLVELTDGDTLYRQPLHPYTEVLISAIPQIEAKKQGQRLVLQGEAPDPALPPGGCRFHPRCPRAADICRRTPPVFQEVSSGHFVACHRA